MYNISKDDYTFADNGFNEMWAIRLKNMYEGVVYCYGKVSAKLDEVAGNGDGLATLSFQYQVLDEADFDKDDLEKSEDFNNYIGDVLKHIIEDSFATNNYRIGDGDDSDNGTEESTNK